MGIPYAIAAKNISAAGLWRLYNPKATSKKKNIPQKLLWLWDKVGYSFNYFICEISLAISNTIPPHQATLPTQIVQKSLKTN